MKLTGGNLYFQKISRVKYKYEYLSDNIYADVVVIGGGISGALTAYYQAKTGAKVIVLEKNIIGYGSTSASTAILEYEIDEGLYRLSKMIGEKSGARCFKLCKNAIDDIESIVNDINISTDYKNDINFERKQCIYFTDKTINRNSMIKEFEAREKAGFDVEFLEEHHMLNLRSGVALKAGAAVMNPYEFTIELFNMLSKMDNVEIFENTVAEEIKVDGEKVQIITNNRFKINSSKCILANGFEAVKYLKDSPETLYKTFGIVTEPIDGIDEKTGNFTAKDMENTCHYIRFTPDGRIILGGEDVKFTDSMKNDMLFKKIANCNYKKLFGWLQKTFSSIENMTIGYCFNGTFANTKDHLPIIDELPDMPNVYCNLGFGANGILYSVIGAKMLKDISKDYYAKDMHLFRIDR